MVSAPVEQPGGEAQEEVDEDEKTADDDIGGAEDLQGSGSCTDEKPEVNPEETSL